MVLPVKRKNLLNDIKRCIEQGNYYDTRHAVERKTERQITRFEVLQVLSNGHHETKKDYFDKNFNEWNYAIKGKKIDGKKLRIVVSFDEHNMLIITQST